MSEQLQQLVQMVMAMLIEQLKALRKQANGQGDGAGDAAGGGDGGGMPSPGGGGPPGGPAPFQPQQPAPAAGPSGGAGAAGGGGPGAVSKPSGPSGAKPPSGQNNTPSGAPNNPSNNPPNNTPNNTPNGASNNAPSSGPAGAPPAGAAGSPSGGQSPGAAGAPAAGAGPSAKPAGANGAQGAAPSNGPPSGDYIDATKFGAKGDGVTDNQAALQSAFKEASATGKAVWIPEGTYKHSGTLEINGAKVSGAGQGTVLEATNPQQGAVKLTGDNSSLSNLSVVSNASERSSMPDAAAVLVQNASNAQVSHVSTQGAASNGIRLDNATGSQITNNFVQGSNADGIALMNGSTNNKVDGNVVYQAGDDAFSSNSYTSDAKQNSGNVFTNNLAKDNAYGRGFALMGSRGETVENNYVSGVPGTGISAGVDPNSDTMAGSDMRIRNNRISGTGDVPVKTSGAGIADEGTQSGGAPDPAEILGWTPEMEDRKAYNAGYTPGTGSGANNTPGNRT